MSAMITEVYDALRSVGVDEDKAKAAASAMFSHDIATRGDVARVDGKVDALDKRILRAERDLLFLKWICGATFLMILSENIGRIFS